MNAIQTRNHVPYMYIFAKWFYLYIHMYTQRGQIAFWRENNCKVLMTNINICFCETERR